MLLAGNISTDKTEILIQNYANLLNSGVDSSQILVLVQNSNKKKEFENETFRFLKTDSIEKLQIHSFFSLVYNTVIDNWAFVENSIQSGKPVIIPNMAGLEVSQYILKELINKVKFKGYNSKKSLLHQMFRRYSLIVQNNLTDDDVEWRSNILGESFADDAKAVLKKFLAKTFELRDFDYLRQSLAFNHIYKNSNCFQKIKYLFLDDGDEITPICFDFIRFLKPQLKEVFIAFDEKGASRTGYLSAHRTSVWEFEKLFEQKSQKLKSECPLSQDAEKLFSLIIKNETEYLQHFSKSSPSKRASMIDEAVKQINLLIDKNIKPSQISVITPVIDDMLKFSFKENIRANLMYLSGSEKLIQNKLVKSSLIILKLIYKIRLSEFDIRIVLSDFLGIPIKYCKKILENFEAEQQFIDYEFKNEEYTKKYIKLKQLIANLSSGSLKLSQIVYEIYDKLACFYTIDKNELNKFNFFIKQLEDFENIFADKIKPEEIINQTENSIISENPYSTLEITPENLIVSTPQKIIDFGIRTKYQIWLDISSDEWIKSDTGPLYNAWVFQRGWSKDSYTIEDNIKLSKEKTARILRKLTLCASEHIYTYSSLFDGNGIENFGGIEEYIKVKENYNAVFDETRTFTITPRDDQKPVLEYKSGKMAISAVPGAGKTTILLALIIKLLDDGINPENIFVMTYMESAARNFRDRIKNIRKNSSQLPNISTIHGLALRILKENGNYERLGLSSDFEICDDTQKSRIIREILQKMNLKKKETDNFEKGISDFKFSGGSFDENTSDTHLKNFRTFFNEYQQKLNENNLIDYDDILISSVKLLKDNPDIRNHYQDICEYIIEDEAQDSSSIQQELINILSGKHKNLIRCGDINQAITTTFSNADVEGFRKFITENNNVSMNRSQRCTKDVWTLANDLIVWAENKNFGGAFFEIFMKPVEGKNPISNNAIKAEIFNSQLEEKNYILNEIKLALKRDPKCTIGILLRTNFQVGQWINFINNSGLKTITRSECLEQKSIFRTIYAVMQIILHPFDNNVIADNYEILAEAGLYKPRLGCEIRKYETPFIQADCDDIDNPYLGQFYWDITYWLYFSNLAVEELAIKIGLHYFSSEIEKSNVYLISTLIKRLSLNYKDFSSLLQRLGELSKKSSLSGFKFFSEEEESDKNITAGKVQVMTLHKSKGDEFDYVFIPEFSNSNLAFDYEQIKSKSADFTEMLKRLNKNYSPKTDNQLMDEQIAENLRLLYVAVTRAKKYLYFTVSTKVKQFSSIKDVEPNVIFTELLEGCNE